MNSELMVHRIESVAGGDVLYGVFEVGFHPSLPYLAFDEAQATLSVVETRTWLRLASLGLEEANTLSFAFSEHLPLIAFGEQSGQVSVWDIAAARLVSTAACRIDPYMESFSPDSRLLSVLTDGDICQLVSVSDGSLVMKKMLDKVRVEYASFCPFGPSFVIVEDSGTVSIRDPKDLREVRSRNLFLNDIAYWSCALSSFTPRVAVRSHDGRVVMWNYQSDDILTLETPPHPLTPMCFSADGSRLLIGQANCVYSVDV